MSSSKAPALLNKLYLHGNVWIAADIHLGPHSPKTASAFFEFLNKAQKEADALILCGDIFNAWIGSDLALEPPRWLAQAIMHFRKTTETLPLFFMRGNRDFLLDSRFAHFVGATLLDDQIIIKTDHCHFILTHGDELCTDDQDYQKYRKRVHNPTIQRLFLKLPLSWRQRIAMDLRKKSKKKQRHLSYEISDVNTESCLQLLHEQHQFLLVHGHTHRPALHTMRDVNGQKFGRYVIPDWECDHNSPTRSGWLAFNQDGTIAMHREHQPTIRFLLKKRF